MDSDKFHTKISEDLGYIKAKVEKIPQIEQDITKLKKDLSHIKGYAAGVGAAFGLGFALMKDFFARLFKGE